ncbi:AMP-binding protein [Geotalea sp. SG265]|uniref:AMP-binding protein n=1 Tax=Geotalea sp. SG265 TaxID=2922867 RepID=UPI001FAE81FB|nr:AMP-binding protein [Geotalea sp. SG265]
MQATMQTLIDLFQTFSQRGGDIAFINRTGVRRLAYSYNDLHLLSRKMARLLADRGVAPGDRVLIWGPNSPWWGVAFWGAIVRGAVAVPVDFMSERERAETIAGLTECTVVIQSRFKMERLDHPGSILLEDLEYELADLEPVADIATPGPDDVAELIYTSGTTGNPKGVILTHGNLIANLLQVNEHIPVVRPEYNFLSLLPLSHMFEQMGGFFTPLYKGSTIVYLRTLKPSAIMEALGEEDIYAMIAVPRLLQLLKSSIERELDEKGLGNVFRFLMKKGETLSPGARKLLFFPIQRKFGRHFSLFVSGGAPLSLDVFLFWQKLGFRVVEGYGLTECSPVLAANTMDKQVAGAVGKSLPGIEITIEDNEILARGKNITPGYYRNEAATREAFTADGRFRTGDMGEVSADGWLTIKGRAKELIVTGAGINVYPDEIEDIFNRTKGVRESCVIGMDRGGGEEVHAVLLLDGSGRKPEEIVDEVNKRLDSLHQVTGFTVWPEAEFPKTTTLKIRKFQVKEKLQKGEKGTGAGAAGDRLVNLIARVTGAGVGEVKEESRLVADLGLSSIARLELVNYLEQEFRLDLEDSVIGPETRVQELRRIIEKREKIAGKNHFRFWTNSNLVRALRMVWDAAFTYPLFRSMATIEARGREKLAEIEGPVFFVSNHLSYIDQPAVMFALPREIRYNTATAAWEEFFFQNYRNALQWLWKRLTYEYATFFHNVFPLPQSSGFRKSFRFMGKLVDSGHNILIFPEGERSIDGRLLPFQRGLGIMVKELDIPVVPVKIEGIEKVLPRGANWPKRGRVTVTFGSPLYLSREEPDTIVEMARGAVERL